jgi:hypothetical protein
MKIDLLRSVPLPLPDVLVEETEVLRDSDLVGKPVVGGVGSSEARRKEGITFEKPIMVLFELLWCDMDGCSDSFAGVVMRV